MDKKINSIKTLVGSYIVYSVLKDIKEMIKKTNENITDELSVPIHLPVEFEYDDRSKKLFNRAVRVLNGNQQFLEILKQIFFDMKYFEFEKDPSVSSVGGAENAHLIQMLGPRYIDLQKIDLYSHTLNVLEQGIKYAEETGRPTGFSLSILACLLHDFGKSTKLRKLLDSGGNNKFSGYKSHSDISAIYVSDYLVNKIYENEGLEDLSMHVFETIENIVKYHHPQKKEQRENLEISFVMKADEFARKEEKRMLKNKK